MTTCSPLVWMPPPFDALPLLTVRPLRVTLILVPPARWMLKMRKFAAVASRRTVRLAAPEPLRVVSSLMFGRTVSREIVPLTPVASITSAPSVELAERMAARRLPAPLSRVLVTVNVAGTARSSMRSSRSSLCRRRRALRLGRDRSDSQRRVLKRALADSSETTGSVGRVANWLGQGRCGMDGRGGSAASQVRVYRPGSRGANKKTVGPRPEKMSAGDGRSRENGDGERRVDLGEIEQGGV